MTLFKTLDHDFIIVTARCNDAVRVVSPNELQSADERMSRLMALLAKYGLVFFGGMLAATGLVDY